MAIGNFILDAAKQAQYKFLTKGGNGVVGDIINEFNEMTLHLLFPNQFPYYLMGFELLDENDNVTDRMVFPMMCQSYSEQYTISARVVKTSGGIVSHTNNGFNPIPIQFTGTFGLDFKLMPLNKRSAAVKIQGAKQTWETTKGYINPFIYTGYGAFNELKRIFSKSKELTIKGKPFKTIFYNLAFSSNYYVQLIEMTGSQSTDKNFFHQFSLSMKAIGVATGKYMNSNTSLDFKQGIKSVSTTAKNIVKKLQKAK